MDRLLVGDVGFGKTEVAVRAAFKVVMDGKQVALLAPTTVLAAQHFETIKERFAPFPVKLEMVSRFRTAEHTREILRSLTAGDSRSGGRHAPALVEGRRLQDSRPARRRRRAAFRRRREGAVEAALDRNRRPLDDRDADPADAADVARGRARPVGHRDAAPGALRDPDVSGAVPEKRRGAGDPSGNAPPGTDLLRPQPG